MKKLTSTAVLLLMPAFAQAAIPMFTIDALPTPPGGSSYANHISGSGIVGSYSDADGNQTYSMWTPGGTQTFLPFGPFSSVGVVASNDNGIVVGGGYGFRQPPTAAYWQGGVGTVLPVDDSDPTHHLYGSTATAVNNAGVIVGYGDTEYGSAGLLWKKNGDIQILLGVNPSGPHYAAAKDINSSGVVAGIATINDVRHAVTWTDGVVKDLGIFDGGFLSSANAINDLGQVVGWGATSDSSGNAFISDGNTLTPLPTIPGMDYGEAFDINNAGWAVGSCIPNGFDPGAATLWVDGVAYNLQDFLPANSGWQLVGATGIGEDGTIVGYGIYNGDQYLAFTMNPISVPEPTAMLSIIGTSMLMLIRRRRLN